MCRIWSTCNHKDTSDTAQVPETTEYQIFIVKRADLYYFFMNFADTFGLDYDIRPAIWYLLLRDLLTLSDFPDIPWIADERRNILKIGPSWLLILKASRTRCQTSKRTSTCLIVTRYLGRVAFIFRGPSDTACRAGYGHFTPPGPSNATKALAIKPYDFDTYLQTEFEAHLANNERESILIACVEALIDDCIVSPPFYILQQILLPTSPFAPREKHRESPQLQEKWTYLRNHSDNLRESKLHLNRFIRNNLDLSQESAAEVSARLCAKLATYISTIEIVEARMQEQISKVASSKATEMAEMSIRESKRVMLGNS